MRVQQVIKRLLSHAPYLRQVDNAIRLPLLQTWLSTVGPHPCFATREHLYAHVAQSIGEPVTFLEFGVHRGQSIRGWANLLTHPDTTLTGFDSFEGLPEAWAYGSQTLAAGHFSTNGDVPAIDDTRVRFVKGWFNQTLPGFLCQMTRDRTLIVNMDADLYSSTLYALTTLHSRLVSGTIVLFDDFSSMLDEFRALDDYTRAYGVTCDVMGAAHGRSYYKHVAIRIR